MHFFSNFGCCDIIFCWSLIVCRYVTTFIVTGKTENEAKIKTENRMKQAQDWFAANPFLINSYKPENMFSFEGFSFDEEWKPVKLIGLMLDSKLLWDP